MKFSYIMGAFFTKFRSSFQEVSFTIDALSPPLQEILYACCLKLMTETLERLKLTVFQLGDVHKTASSECTLQGAKNIEVRGC